MHDAGTSPWLHFEVEDEPFTTAWCGQDACSQRLLSRLLACAAAVPALHPTLGLSCSFSDLLRAHLHTSAVRVSSARSQLLQLVPEQCALSAAVVRLCRHNANVPVRN